MTNDKPELPELKKLQQAFKRFSKLKEPEWTTHYYGVAMEGARQFGTYLLENGFLNTGLTLEESRPAPDNNGWRDISTAPRDGRHIAVLTESGSLVRAFWGWVDDELAWMAVTEGEHPSCWTDGICWKSNADGERSDPPECWQPLPPPPALDKGE